MRTNTGMKTFALRLKVKPERQVPAGERSEGEVRGPAHRQLLCCNDHAFRRQPAKVQKCDESSVKVSCLKGDILYKTHGFLFRMLEKTVLI